MPPNRTNQIQEEMDRLIAEINSLATACRSVNKEVDKSALNLKKAQEAASLAESAYLCIKAKADKVHKDQRYLQKRLQELAAEYAKCDFSNPREEDQKALPRATKRSGEDEGEPSNKRIRAEGPDTSPQIPEVDQFFQLLDREYLQFGGPSQQKSVKSLMQSSVSAYLTLTERHQSVLQRSVPATTTRPRPIVRLPPTSSKEPISIKHELRPHGDIKVPSSPMNRAVPSLPPRPRAQYTTGTSPMKALKRRKSTNRDWRSYKQLEPWEKGIVEEWDNPRWLPLESRARMDYFLFKHQSPKGYWNTKTVVMPRKTCPQIKEQIMNFFEKNSVGRSELLFYEDGKYLGISYWDLDDSQGLLLLPGARRFIGAGEPDNYRGTHTAHDQTVGFV